MAVPEEADDGGDLGECPLTRLRSSLLPDESNVDDDVSGELRR